MAQEDKALVMRGLFLLALIGAIVMIVMTIILWNQQGPPPAATETPPEYRIAALAAPVGNDFASQLAWLAEYAQVRETLPSAPGWGIRYNAAATLARRGSAHVPWQTFREMLDEKQQLRNNGVRLPDGQFTYDEVTARAFTIVALKALATWHEKQPESKHVALPELRDLYPLVDALAQSPQLELKTQAEKTRSVLFR